LFIEDDMWDRPANNVLIVSEGVMSTGASILVDSVGPL
jgi:hypothetical protein